MVEANAADTERALNDLARHQMIVRILNDIRIDMTVREICGWDKMEYIRMLQEEIGNIGRQ